MRGNDDQRLDALFRAYREACPAPEPSANFMPNLWQRIEARQTLHVFLPPHGQCLGDGRRRASIALGVYMSIPRPTRLLAELYRGAGGSQTLDAPEIVRPGAPGSSRPGPVS